MAKNTNLDKEMEAEMEGMEDSDEDMSGDEDETDPELENKIAAAEEELRTNPFSYTAHEELVKLLKSSEDLEKLRAAREAFSRAYPLTGELWLDWVKDEQRIATTAEDRQFISQLFKRGVEDYQSVDLWLEYCMFSMGGLASAEGQAEARAVHEAAITACGLNTAKGSLVWAGYRELEAALLALLPAQGTEEQVATFSSQRERLAKLFNRQLRQPLLGMEATLREYKEWAGEKLDSGVVSEYHKAREKLKKREQHENALAKALARERLDRFREYIKLEVKEGDPARVQCLYERGVTQHCLDVDLWEEYLGYLEEHLKMGPVSLPVFSRGVRNCPWSVELWCHYLRAMERYQSSAKDITAVFEQALAAGFGEPSAYLELWLTFIDYRRRGTDFQKEVTPGMEELRTVFERARLHLGEVGGDPESQVAKYQATLEADQFGSMDVARQIWAAVLQADPFKAAQWMEFIQLEKIFGDKKHLRKAYQRALEKTFDQPALVAKSFLQFEREEGSLEAWEICRKQCRARLAKVGSRQSKQAEKEQEEEARRHEKVEKKKEKDKQYRRDKRQDEAAAKRGADPFNGVKPGKVPIFKRPLPGAGLPQVEPPPGFTPPPGFNPKKRTIEPPPGFKEPSAKKQKTVSDSDYSDMTETKQRELRTVFLSNLSYEVDDDLIKDTMRSSGAVSEVRLVKTPAGKSKGYAFVEFEDREAAAEAIDRDNELLDGRPMYISECGQNKKEGGAAFKFKTELEKNKLFVRGIDLAVTQEEVRQLFAQHGTLTGVRLVTYRNGHSKGIAFIEYSTEAEAAVGLIKTDGTKLGEGEIHVALSNPPKKDAAPPAPAVDMSGVQSLGGSNLPQGPRGKGRSQLAFTPRVLSSVASKNSQSAAMKLQPMKFVKPGGAKAGGGGAGEGKNGGDGQKTEDGANGANGDNGANEDNGANGEKPAEVANGGGAKSNSDFRSMFLK